MKPIKAYLSGVKLGVLLSAGVLSILPLASGVSADTATASYQFEATLTEATNSLRRVALPAEVLTELTQPDYADLVVVNAAGEVVPFQIKHTQPVLQQQVEERSFNVYRGDDQERLGYLLSLQPNTRADVSLISRTDETYLILQDEGYRDKGLPLQKLTLQWSDLQQWLPKSLRVEASHDLLHWQSVPHKTLPYVFTAANRTLENRSIVLAEPVRAPFIRLIGGEDFAAGLSDTLGVDGEFGTERSHTDLNWLALPLQATQQANAFEVHVPPALPISAWRLAIAAPDQVYVGDWSILMSTSSRYGEPPYRAEQGAFQQYRFRTAAGELQSEPINASVAAGASALQLQFATGSAVPSASQAPLEVAWQPLELRFIAQGAGPFKLRFANATLEPLSQQQSDALFSEVALNQLTSETVTINKPVRVAAAPQPPSHRSLQLGLWALLAIAVVGLLFMVWRLWQQMQHKTEA